MMELELLHIYQNAINISDTTPFFVGVEQVNYADSLVYRRVGRIFPTLLVVIGRNTNVFTSFSVLVMLVHFMLPLSCKASP